MVVLLTLVSTTMSARSARASVDVEERIGALDLERQELLTAGDVTGALRVVREMATLDPHHPKAYLNLVLLQRKLRTLDRALELMPSLGAPGGPGPIYGRALVLYMKREFEGASQQFEEARRGYVDLPHGAGEAACLTMLGNLDRRAGRHDRAMTRYVVARERLQEIGDRLGEASVLSAMAKVERARGRPTRALEQQRAILDIREELGDREGQVKTWAEIGASAFAAGDVSTASDAYERAIFLERELADEEGELLLLNRLATGLHEAGRSRAAIARHEDALELASRLGGVKETAPIRTSLGRIAQHLGDHVGARSWLTTAIEELTTLGDPTPLAEARYRLAVISRRLGELAAAQEHVAKGLEVAGGREARRWRAGLLSERGLVRLAQGDLTGALEDQEHARTLHRELGHAGAELTDLNNLGAIYRRLGDLERARRDLRSALELAEKLDDPRDLARAHNNLGALALETGDHAAARRHFATARQGWRELDDKRGLAIVGANLGELLTRVGELEKARGELREALNLYRRLEDRQGEAATQLQLAHHWQVADAPERSRRAAVAARGLARRHGLADEAWRAEIALARALESSGDREGALTHARIALDHVESLRAGLAADTFKVSFLADKIAIHERVLGLLLADGHDDDDVAQAFHVAERARARGLLDLLAESRAAPVDTLDPALKQDLETARDRLSSATQRLASAKTRAARQRARREVSRAEEEVALARAAVRRGDPRLAELVDPRTLSVEEVQRTLTHDEVLVEYFFGESVAWAWEVRADSLTLHELPSNDRLRDEVDRHLAELESPAVALLGHATPSDRARRLASMLLPMDLDDVGRVLVVPDGPLHVLPFETLARSDRLLVETHEVALVPSATTLAWLRRETEGHDGELFVGLADPVPTSDDPRFPPLPHARAEVARIAALFPADRAMVLEGAEATRTALEGRPLDRLRALHFATHGWLDARDLRHGGLQLAGPEGGAALLSSADVFGLRLRSDVVVLSACRSGTGDHRRGEGLLGLTRAFLHAGASSVVVSLWNVNDASTADFMESFHRSLHEVAPGHPDNVVLVTSGAGDVDVPPSLRGRVVDVGFLSDTQRDNAMAA
ncbi:MAG: CHAT domain-containing tetratricopeptide repeat protein, partial [Acidobacteriota bacterium]